MNKSISVIGDIMLDIYWHGSVQRLSPEAPVPVLLKKKETFMPGGAANVALGLSKCGVNTSLLAFVGNDLNGSKLIDALLNQNLNLNLISIENYTTTTKLRLMADSHHLLRVDEEQNNHNLFKDSHLFSNLLKEINNQIVVISDYNKGTVNNASSSEKNWIELMRSQSNYVIVDPKGTNISKYSGANIITPNLKEFEVFYGSCNSLEELEEKGRRCIYEMGFDALLITLGEKGMSLFTPDKIDHIPAKKIEVTDVTGAGDTVVMYLAYGILNGLDILSAAKLANEAASLSVQRLGVAHILPQELNLD